MKKTTRARAARVIIDTPDDDDDDDDETPEEATEPDELEQLLGELGAAASNARIIVHRVAANAEPEECVDCPLSLFRKDTLRAQYGPGAYRVEVRKSGKIVRRWSWRFAAPLPEQQQPRDDGRVRELELALVAQRDREQQRSHELLLAMIQRPQPTQPAGPSLSDLLGTLTQARELLGGSGGGVKDILSSVRDVLALRDQIGGNDRETNAADVIREGLGLLPELMQTVRAQQAQTPQPNETSSPALPKAAAPAARDRIVANILQHAALGTAPPLVARLLWAQMQALDENVFDSLCGALDSGGAVQLLIMLEPRLATARAWLEQVAAELRPLISSADSAAGLTDAAGTGDAEGEHMDG